jgi:hypothetical protein
VKFADSSEKLGASYGESPVVDTGAMTVLSPMSGVTECASPYTKHNQTLDSIDILNFEYIEHCESLADLERVVRLLGGSVNKSPRLLSAAKERLVAVQKQYGVNTATASVPPPPPPPPCQDAKSKYSGSQEAQERETVPAENEKPSPNREDLAQEVANLSRITAANTTLDSIDPSKSTLNFSLSPSSTLQGVNLVDTPTFPEHFFQFSTSGRLGSIPESPAREQHRSLQHQIRLPDTLSEHVKTDEEKQFQRVITELRQQLEKARSETERREAEVDKTKDEHEETRKTLDMTRAAFCKKDQENRALEARLEAKISELSQALASTADRSRLVVSAERTLRTQCEEELSKQNRSNLVLNKELRETRDSLELIKKRHLHFRLELMKVAGIPKTELKSLSQEEFVSCLSHKIKTLQQQNESMSRTLTNAKQAIAERRGMEVKLGETMSANERLETENIRLSQKIRELRAEVKSSRAYIDKLLKTSHETKEDEWEKQEEQYKCVIQNLRQQIRQQESTISIDLYKSAVEESRQKLAKLRVAESTVTKLGEKIAQLEKEKASMSKIAATPRTAAKEAKPKRSVMFSPTDRLERGLLEGFVPTSTTKAFAEAPIPAIAAKPTHTPKASQSKVNVEEKKPDDLTGITISFENAVSPRTPAGLFTKRTLGNKSSNQKSRILRDVSENNGAQGKSFTSPSWSTANTPQNAKTEKCSSGWDVKDAYHVPDFGKENTTKNPKTPRSASKEVRERFGGPRALHDKLKKMRSPKLSKPTGMPMREVQVIFH